jgi:hypothetical protein
MIARAANLGAHFLADVFISYVRGDRPIAAEIASCLEDAQLSVSNEPMPNATKVSPKSIRSRCSGPSLTILASKRSCAR